MVAILLLSTARILNHQALSIQVCPKKGINPRVLLWGWDWDHQSYSRDGSGCLGKNIQGGSSHHLWIVVGDQWRILQAVGGSQVVFRRSMWFSQKAFGAPMFWYVAIYVL